MDETTTGTVDTPDASTATVETSSTTAAAPTTAKAAIESVLAKHSAAEQDGAATAPAAEGGASPASKQGPIPFEVHTKALENARTKERDAALKEWKEKFGWAEQVNPQEFQQLQQIARHFAGGNPIEGLQSLLAEIRKDPQHDAALRSLAAKQLAAARSQQHTDAEPEFLVSQADGSMAFDPARFAEWKQWNQRQLLAQVEQKVQPFHEMAKALQDREAAVAKQADVTRYVDSTFADVKTWPGMDSEANQKAVADALSAMRINDDDPREVTIALNAAYRQAVLPKLSQAEHASTLASLKQKAAAKVESTTAAAPSTIARPKTPKELAAFMAQRAAARGR